MAEAAWAVNAMAAAQQASREGVPAAAERVTARAFGFMTKRAEAGCARTPGASVVTSRVRPVWQCGH